MPEPLFRDSMGPQHKQFLCSPEQSLRLPLIRVCPSKPRNQEVSGPVLEDDCDPTMKHARYTKPLGWTIAATALMTGMLSLGRDTSRDAPVLSLSQAVQVALDHTRPVIIAKLDIDKSKWTLAQTKTKRFPAITTYLFASGDITSPTFNFPAGSFGFDKPQTFKLSPGVTGYASVQAAQPFSQLYQIHLAIREQELSVDYSGEQYRGKRQSLAASVKQAYYAVLQTESALEAQQALVKSYEETDRVTAQYLTQASVLKSDSLQVKAKLAQAQYQIIQLRDTLDTQKEQLNELLGRDVDVPFRTEAVPPMTATEMDLKAARQAATER